MKTWPSALRLLSVFVCRRPRRRLRRRERSDAASPSPRVGVMHVGTDHNPPSLATLVAGLGDLGWFDGSPTQVMQQLIGDGTLVNGRMKQVQGEYDGQRIQLIWRNLDGKDQAAAAGPGIRSRARRPDRRVRGHVHRARRRTRRRIPANRIPVVFLHPSDPVRDGLVDSLVASGREPDRGVRRARPGRQAARDLPARSCRTAAPAPAHARRSDRRPATPPLLVEARDAAGKLGIELDEHEASDDAGLERRLPARSRRARSTACSSCRPACGSTSPTKILGLAAAANLPVQAHRKEWVDPQKNDKGALFSFGVDVAPVGTAAARFVDSILKGAKPADLPAQEVPKVEFALSLKRAAELGITVPDGRRSRRPTWSIDSRRRTLEPTVATPARPHRRLVWKYVAVVGTLVAAAIVSVGISEFWFSYEDSKRAVTEAEADKASSAAISIRQFIAGARRRPRAAWPSRSRATRRTRIASGRSGTCSCASAAISALTYLDATGTACVHAYSNEVDKIDSLDRARPTAPTARRSGAPGPSSGIIGSRRLRPADGRPHMTIAVAEAPPGEGVIVADVDLGSVVDAIRRAQIGTAGYAYAVDAGGQVIAHTANNSLVLADTNLGGAAAGARRPGRRRSGHRAWSPTDAIRRGREVLSAFERVDPPGWRVFVEEPLERGVRTHPGGDLADGGAPGRVPPGGDRDERAARPEPRQADRGDPGRGGEDRLRVARPADRRLQPRRARRPRRRVQPDGRPAGGVLRGARAAGRGANPRAGRPRWRSWTRRPASSRPPVATSRNSWPTCRTSCGPR